MRGPSGAEADTFLKMIDKHREILVRLYGDKTGALVSEEEEGAISLLRSLGIVRRIDANTYRLSKELRQLIDKGVNRSHLRDLSVDIGDQIDTLELCLQAYENAKIDGDLDAIQAEQDELKSICFELSDFFADKADKLGKSSIGELENIEYGEARVKRIEIILKKLDALIIAYEKIEKRFADEDFADNGFLEALRLRFQFDTTKYLDVSKNTRDEIRAALHVRKNQEHKTCVLLKLEQLLNTNPSVAFSTAKDHAHKLDYFVHANPVILKSNVDIQSFDNDLLDKYRILISKLQNKKPVLAKEFKRQASENVSSEAQRREKEIKLSQRMFKSLLKEIITNKTTLTAKEFYTAYPASKGIRFAYWLHYCFHQPLYMKRQPSKQRITRLFSYQPCFDAFYDHEGNRTLTDIVFISSQAHNPRLETEVDN
jgi:hypothetical protein